MLRRQDGGRRQRRDAKHLWPDFHGLRHHLSSKSFAGHELGFHSAFGQELREHEGADFVALVARRQAEDAALALGVQVFTKFRKDHAEEGESFPPLVVVEIALACFQIEQMERRDDNLVVSLSERMRGAILFTQAGKLLAIEGQQTLVKAIRDRNGRSIAEEHIEECEVRQILSDHRDADGERGGEKQPDSAPQPAPENCGNDDGHRRKAGARAVEPRLDDVVGEQFHDDEERGDKRGGRPVRRHGERQRQGEKRSNPRPDVGHETQDRRDQPPQDGVGNPDEIKADADGNAVADIHDALRDEVAADPRAGFVQRLGGDVDAPTPGEVDEPIPQILPFEEHENDEDDDHRRHPQRPEDRRGESAQGFHGAARRIDDLHRDGSTGGGRLRSWGASGRVGRCSGRRGGSFLENSALNSRRVPEARFHGLSLVVLSEAILACRFVLYVSSS